MALIVFFLLNWLFVLIVAYLQKRYCGTNLKERYYRYRKNILQFIFIFNTLENILVAFFITLFGTIISIMILLDFINCIKIDNKKIKIIETYRPKFTYLHKNNVVEQYQE